MRVSVRLSDIVACFWCIYAACIATAALQMCGIVVGRLSLLHCHNLHNEGI